MAEYEPMEIRGFYRSHSHLPIWEVMDKAGIWEQVGLKVTFEFCDSSSAAEKALFDGSVDFVSGNHISPYLLVRKGKPIVSLSSHSNSVNDRLVARFPIKQISELGGKRIGDTTLVDSIGGYHHPRGNHMNLFHNADYIFNSDYTFFDRFDPRTEGYFSGQGELTGRFFLTTNFVPDTHTLKLTDYSERGKGSTNMSRRRS